MLIIAGSSRNFLHSANKDSSCDTAEIEVCGASSLGEEEEASAIVSKTETSVSCSSLTERSSSMAVWIGIAQFSDLLSTNSFCKWVTVVPWSESPIDFVRRFSLLRSRFLPLGRFKIASSIGFSAPVKRPREAIPFSHCSRTSNPSQRRVEFWQFMQIGREPSHFWRYRLQVQQPSRDRLCDCVDMPNLHSQYYGAARTRWEMSSSAVRGTTCDFVTFVASWQYDVSRLPATSKYLT